MNASVIQIWNGIEKWNIFYSFDAMRGLKPSKYTEYKEFRTQKWIGWTIDWLINISECFEVIGITLPHKVCTHRVFANRLKKLPMVFLNKKVATNKWKLFCCLCCCGCYCYSLSLSYIHTHSLTHSHKAHYYKREMGKRK